MRKPLLSVRRLRNISACNMLWISRKKRIILSLAILPLRMQTANVFTAITASLAHNHYEKLEKKASDCLKCGHCNHRCPFHVDQISRMESIAAYFEML